MKNLIFKYSEYKDQIFGGEAFYVKYAYFSSIRFDKHTSRCNVCFDAILDDNRTVNLQFCILFGDKREYHEYYDKYYNIFPTGISIDSIVPRIIAISCFFKQHEKNYEYYSIYTKQLNSTDDTNDLVFRVDMPRNVFYQIMFIMDHIRHKETIDRDNIQQLNKFNTFRDIVKLTKLGNDYDISVIGKVHYRIPKLFDSTMHSHAMIEFYKNGNPEFAIDILTKIDKKYRWAPKTMCNFRAFDMQMFGYQKNTNRPAYYIVNSFPIEYSISADTPMSKTLLLALDTNAEFRYFTIQDNFYSKVKETVCEYLE